MITINNYTEYLTITVNELNINRDGEWLKAVVLRFPKENFSFREALSIAKQAKTISIQMSNKAITYSVSDMIDSKSNDYYTEVQLINPSTLINDNLDFKVRKLEEQLVTEKELLDIVMGDVVVSEAISIPLEDEEVEPISQSKLNAMSFRKQIEVVCDNLDDKVASVSVALFNKMRWDGSLIPVGKRIQYNGILYKASVDLWDTEENSPENAPTLWGKIQYHNGVRIIPEVITVTTAFAFNELGYWEADGKTYKSRKDANVHTPAAYPEGWELQK